MTSEELADEVENLITKTRARVLGVGKDQYEQPDGTQTFEGMSPDTLVEWLEEEIEDSVVYLTMLKIRIRRMRAAPP